MKPVRLIAFRSMLIAVLFFGTFASAQTISPALGVRQPLGVDFVGYNGTNTYQANEWWNEPNLMGHIPLLKPKTLRYPGGGISNWWDWKRGWFANRPDLPAKYVALPIKADFLENFKLTLDSSHATAVFDLNMMTASLQDQLAMLKHAQAIGMVVKYVELGNEYYILGTDDGAGDGDSALLMQEYPTADVYGDSATIWIDSIHHYFPTAKIAAQGTFNKNNQTRRATWDTIMLKTLRRENAITFHCYYTGENAANSTPTYTSSDVPEFLWRPIDAWNTLSTLDLPGVPPGDEVWITEFNLDDYVKPVHGSWGHGLFLANLAMQFFQDWRITLINCHNMNGSSVHGTYFQSNSGFNYTDDNGNIPPPNPPPTTPWSLTAGGVTMKLIGKTTAGMTYTAPLVFKNGPTVNFTDETGAAISYPALFGFLFTNSNTSDVLVLNLSATSYKMYTKDILPAGGTFDKYDANPLSYISDDSQVEHITGTLTSDSTQITLKPYSITRIVGNSIPAPPPPTTQITALGSTNLCAGQSVQLDAGAGYLEYQWSTGETTRKITVSAAGKYWVRAWMIHNGYATGDTIAIVVNPLPSTVAIGTGGAVRQFCDGGSITITPNRDISTYGVLWNNGSTNPQSITVTTSGTYWLTITDQNGCKINSDSETITVYPLPHATITPAGPVQTCSGFPVNLNAGTGPKFKSFTWSDGRFGQILNVTKTGVYSVQVTDSNGCKGNSTNAVTVNVDSVPTPLIIPSGPTTFCQGTNFSFTAPNGYQQYQWQKTSVNITGATSKTYFPTTAGNYRVIVTDNFGCSATSAATSITINGLPTPHLSVPGSNSMCQGSSITISNTQVWNSYLWNTGATTQTITVFTAGNYFCTITNSNGCAGTTETETITVNPLPQPTITAQGPTSFCNGGAVTLDAGALYSHYTWSNGKSTQTISATTAGGYTCTVTDVNGCINTTPSTNITVWTAPTPIITPSGPTTFCASDNVYLSSSVGSSYQWLKGSVAIAGATQQTYYPSSTNLSYKVTTTDVHGCSATSDPMSITVNSNPTPLIISSAGNAICLGSSSTLSINAAYSTYQWSTGATTSTISVSSAGNYSCTITNTNGCSGTTPAQSISINPLPTPAITAQGPTSFCSGGSVTLDAGAGYSHYNWSNGKATQTIIASAAGPYTVTVTDGNGCNGTSSASNVTVWTVPTPIITPSGPTAFCASDNVYLSTIAGYSYQWFKGSVAITGATQQTYYPTVTNLSYKVTITDSHGCTATSDPISITVNSNPTPSIISSTGNAVCLGSSTTLSLNTTYSTYHWSTGATIPTISVSTAGIYTCMVTNSSGCSATTPIQSISINPLPIATIIAQGPISFCTGGSVTLDAGAGYSHYNWSNGKATQTILTSAAGPYTVTVTDGNGCNGTSAATNVTVWTVPTPIITPSGPTTFCASDNVYLSTIAGYSYQWFKGSVAITGATQQTYYPTVTNLNYKVTITDSHGCSATSDPISITVNSNPTPSIISSTGNGVCLGSSTTLSLNTAYSTYHWSTGATTSTISVSTAGNYTCTVTNSTGCSAITPVQSISINPLPTPTITAQGPTSFCSGGSVILDAGAGYSQYNWSNGKATQTITASAAGPYTVTVTNTNGCNGTSAATNVTVWTVPTPIITPSGPTTFCASDNVYLSTIAGYSYQWFKGSTAIAGATQQTYYPTSTSTTYKVTITDSHGCSATSATISITVNSNPTPSIISSAGNAICQGSSTTLSLNTAYSTYHWSTGATTSTISVSSAGNYSCTVTNSSGCSAITPVQSISINPLPTATITAQGPTSFCNGGSVILDAGAGYTHYSWSNGKTTQTITVTTGGSYTSTVTNTNGCTATSAATSVTVWTPAQPVVTAGGATTFCSGFSVLLSTANTYSTYQWQKSNVNVNGATNNTYSATATGSYKVITGDAHGCTATSTTSISVTVNKLPTASISVSGSLNICNGQTKTLTAKAGTGYHFQWKQNGVNIPGATGGTYVASTAGDYTYTVTDGNGCSATSSAKTITANCKEGDAVIDNSDDQPAGLAIYPNPVTSQLNVKVQFNSDSPIMCTTEIRNILGQLIFTQDKMMDGKTLTEELKLETGIPQGLYIISVRKGKEVYLKEFIVDRN